MKTTMFCLIFFISSQHLSDRDVGKLIFFWNAKIAFSKGGMAKL